MSALCASIRSRNSRVMNRWCSPNRPVNASVNAGIFGRILGCTSSAIAAGSCSPSINASSIARADTPVMLDTFGFIRGACAKKVSKSTFRSICRCSAGSS